MLETGKSVEVEIEQSFTVSVSDGAREQEACEALLVTRMRAIGAEESERRQLVDFIYELDYGRVRRGSLGIAMAADNGRWGMYLLEVGTDLRRLSLLMGGCSA